MMNPKIPMSEYRAVFENAVFDYLEQEAEINAITPAQALEIVQYVNKNILNASDLEKFKQSVEKFITLFPKLKVILENAFSQYEKEQKYKIT